MMKINREQMSHFESEAMLRFLEKLRAHMGAKYPGVFQGIDEATQAIMIANGVARARSYGLKSESAIAKFVQLMAAIAPNFDQQPEIHAILTDDRMSPDVRFDTLRKSVSEDAWESARSLAPPDAWFDPAAPVGDAS